MSLTEWYLTVCFSLWIWCNTEAIQTTVEFIEKLKKGNC